MPENRGDTKSSRRELPEGKRCMRPEGKQKLRAAVDAFGGKLLEGLARAGECCQRPRTSQERLVHWLLRTRGRTSVICVKLGPKARG